MKKFVRGLLGRAIGVALIAILLVPNVLLSQATMAQAATGGRQNIILLPLQTVGDIPFDLAGKILQELQLMLAGQVGVQVDTLTPSSLILTRAKSQMDEESQKKLMEGYQTANDGTAKQDARVAAAGTLAEMLGVDAVVFGVIDEYEFSSRPDPNQSLIHITATKVTKERNQPALASPLVIIGRSRALPDKGGAQTSHDAEAIGNTARSLAAQLTGKVPPPMKGEKPVKPTKVSSAAPTPSRDVDMEEYDAPKPKMSTATKVFIGIGAGILAGLIFSGGSGGTKAASLPVVASLGWATSTVDGVEIQIERPEKAVARYQILREDRGPAATSSTRALLSTRVPTTVVATINPIDAVLQNNYIYLTDGARSTIKPTTGRLYAYKVVTVYTDGSTKEYTIYNAGNPAAQVDTTGPSVPPPVQSVSATPVSGSIVQISWTLGTTLPAFVTGFAIERKLASDPPSKWVGDGALVPAGSRSATRTVSEPGVYQYRVFAVGPSGYIHPLQVYRSVDVLVGKPLPVDTVTITAVARTNTRGAVSLNVQWPAPTDNFINGYEVSRTAVLRSRSVTTGITGINSKLPSSTSDRNGRGRNTSIDTLRSPSRVDAPVWTKVATITTRAQNFYLDNDVTDRYEYTYKVVTLAGTTTSYQSDPKLSQPYRVNLAPGDVSGMNVLSTRGQVRFGWVAPLKNADGITDLLDPDHYEIWMTASTAVPAGTTTVTKDNLTRYFTKIATAAWGTITFTDPNATLRQLLHYAVVPVDASGQSALGDYPLVEVTELPAVTSVAIAPTTLEVTAGASAEQLTLTAIGSDNLPVPGVDLAVNCTRGKLSLAADGTNGVASMTVTSGPNGRSTVYWKTISTDSGDSIITVNLVTDGRADPGISAQTYATIKAAVAETITLDVTDDTLVVVDTAAPYAALDPAKPHITKATVTVTDSRGVPVINRKVVFACSDVNFAYPGSDRITGTADDSNIAYTNNAGVATMNIRAGFKTGDATLMAFVGSLTKDITMHLVPGLPAAPIGISLQTDRLPARDTSSTTGTVEVKDKNQNAVPETVVLLTTSLGLVEPIVVNTGADGKATFTLKAVYLPADVLTDNARVTATIPELGIASTANVTFVGLYPNKLELTSNVPSLVAASDSQVILTAKVYDTFGSLVKDNTEVSFHVEGGGVFQSSSTRDVKMRTLGGSASAVLLGTPINTAVDLVVTATSGLISNTLTLVMEPRTDVVKVTVTPANKNLEIPTTLGQLPDPLSTTLSILVTNKGLPEPNATIELFASAGTLQKTATTGIDGWAKGIAYTGPNTPMVVTITAKALEVTGATQITIRGGTAALVELSCAGPWSLFRTNGRPTPADWSTIFYARVTDEYGNAVPDGTVVYFEAVEPNSYTVDTTAVDFKGNPFTVLGRDGQRGLPVPNTGRPYGTITQKATTAAGACQVTLLSADRNTPTGGAEVLARVNRPDGKYVFSNTFRVAGPAQYQNRVLMVGAPDENMSSLSITLGGMPITGPVKAGTPLTVRADLYDKLGQPCAGNTPITVTYTFVDDNITAATTVVGGSDEVGGFTKEVIVTDLKNASTRPLMVTLDIPQQLNEMPITLFSNVITMRSDVPNSMTLSLKPYVEGTSATQIYTYRQAGNGYLGPDQMFVIADNILDRFKNPVVPTSFDADSTVFFSGWGSFRTDMGDPSSEASIFSRIINGTVISSSSATYRCPFPTSEKIQAFAGNCSSEVPIKIIGGAGSVKFSFTKKAVQASSDTDTGMDASDVIITASDSDGKAIPDVDKVGVYLSSTMGSLENQPDFIMLTTSQIKAKFVVNPDVNPASGYVTYSWASGNMAVNNLPTSLQVIGPPTNITVAGPTSMIASETATVTARVTDVNAQPALKDAIYVYFTTDTGFTMDPADGKVKVGSNGIASVKIKATDVTKVTARTVSVTARAGAVSGTLVPPIQFLKPVKDLRMAVSKTLLPNSGDINSDGLPDLNSTATVTVTGLDDAGMTVPDGTSVSLVNSNGAEFTDQAGNSLGSSTVQTFTNGVVRLGIRGPIFGQALAGAATITATSGAVKLDDKTLVFVGPPAKLTMTLAPATTTVVGSRVAGNVTVLDAADKPVFDGYKLNLDVIGAAQATVSSAGGAYVNPPMAITTGGGGATFNVVAVTSGLATVKVSYGTVSATADYTFVGTGAMTMTINPSRFVSDGNAFAVVTVRGYLPGTVNPVPDSTPVTLTTSKGYFNGNPLRTTLTGVFNGGIFTARLYGKAAPVAADLGALDIQADSTGISYTGTATLYGPVDSIVFDTPATTAVVVNRPMALTARLFDLIPATSDALVTVRTTDANNLVLLPGAVQSVNGVANISVTPTVVGTYKVTALANGKSDELTFDVKASLPTVLDIAPVGVTEAKARVAADGSSTPIAYQITATDAANLPAGNITVHVATNPARGLISLDQDDFSAAAQAVDVRLDANGTGTIYINGTAGTQPGAVEVTATVNALSDKTTVRFIGKPASFTFTTNSARMLANMLATTPATPDAVTLKATLRDSANQTVLDGTPVVLSVALAGGGAVPTTDYRFTPSLPKTTDGSVSVTFMSKRISVVGDVASGNGLTVSATAAGDAGNLASKTVTVSSEGAQILTVATTAGNPARISADGIFGPAGTNQTSVDVIGTAVNSNGDTLTGPQIYGLPITVSTAKGILAGRGSSLDTTFGLTGLATMTLAGSIGVAPGNGLVTATSGASTSDPLAVAFVGPADPNNFTFTHALTDSTGDGIPDIYQDGVFTLEVTAKDNAVPTTQAVLKGTTMSIQATGLTVTGNTDTITADDSGKVRWTLTATTAGIRDVYVSADGITSARSFRVNVIPVAKDYKIVVKEEKRIFFDPTTAANLPKSTSFELTGYQIVGGAVQPYAEVLLSTDMGQFVTGEGVTPSVDGKTAKVVLNQSGTALIRFRGDAANVGTPNLTATSGTVGNLPKSLNTGATPIQLIGNPYRIIVQAYGKFAGTTTLTDDLRVMQDNPVTIQAEVQDKAGNSVLDGFMVDFMLPAGSQGILRAATSLIKYDATTKTSVVKADLASNYAGVYTVTGQALDTFGVAVPGATDSTTVTIRTYAKNFTINVGDVAPTRIAQDGTESAKVTVRGTDANGDPVLAGTPAHFTILQRDSALSLLVDPINSADFGATQDMLFDENGQTEVFIRGSGALGLIGTAGVQISSYNSGAAVPGPDTNPTFVGEFPDLVTIYGPGKAAVSGQLTAVMAPASVVPGSTATLTVALVDKTTGRAYYPDWYTLTVTSDTGMLIGTQKLSTADPNKGACSLDYSLSAAEADIKLANANPADRKIHITVKVTGLEQTGAGLLQQTFDFDIAPKPWPGITDPAVTYSVDSMVPTTLLTDGLNITTFGTMVLQFRDGDNLSLGEGRNIAVQVSDGGMARDANGTGIDSATAIIPTGTDGKISVIVTAPAQMPATGKITLTLRDVDANTVLTQVPAGALTIPIKNAKPVVDFTLRGDGPQKIYYNPLLQDQIIANLPLRTYIILKGTDGKGDGSAGAQMTISTDRGEMRKGSIGAFSQSITTTLDALGELKLEFQGRGDETELGAPTFTASDLGIDGTLTVKSPIITPPTNVGWNWDASGSIYLVGKPVTVSTTLQNSEAFQQVDTRVDVTVLDKIGQPVLDNWPVEFIQTSTMWPDPTDATSVVDWRETQGAGVFRVPTSPVTVNGMCSSQFASNHSGLYSVGVRVKDAVTPGMPQPIYHYISALRDIKVKTFARNYIITGEAPARILCDGSQVSRLVVVCYDFDGKKLLEGIKLGIHPNLGILVYLDKNNVETLSIAQPIAQAYPVGFMDVFTNAEAELRLFSRGFNRIGRVGIEINNNAMDASLPNYVWNSEVSPTFSLIHFGPDPADPNQLISVTPPTSVIAGSNQQNDSVDNKRVDYTVVLHDAYDNPYPYGYKVTLLENGVEPSSFVSDNRKTPVTRTWSGRNDVPDGTPAIIGQCKLRFAKNVNATTSRNITVKIEGEKDTAAVTAVWPATPNSVDVTRPSGATFTDPINTIVIGLNETKRLDALVSVGGAIVLDGFPIQYESVTQAGGPAVSFTNATVSTAMGGAISNTLNAGAVPGKVKVQLYYTDYNGVVIRPLGSLTPDIYIGIPNAAALTNAAWANVAANSNTAMIAALTTGGVAVVNTYPITVSSSNGSITGGSATVGAGGQVNFSFNAPNVTAGQTLPVNITFYDRAPLFTNGTLRTSIPITIYGVPATPINAGATAGAADSKQSTITWGAPAGSVPVTGYFVRYYINGFPAGGTTWTGAANTLTVTTPNKGDVITYQIAAYNGAGTGSYTGIQTAPVAP